MTAHAMTVKSYLSHAVAKPAVAGLAAAVIDHYVMGDVSYRRNAMFGGAVGAGIFAVSWVEPLVAPMFPTKTPLGHIGKALEGRIVEIACGSGAAYALNHFVLKNQLNPNQLLKKLGVIVAADIIGETACELLLIV